jgi:hypothetical protein
MTTQITMIFWCDTDTGQACLEYSWVPQGNRKVIRLPPQQGEDSRKDPIDDLNITQVEVYRLVCNNVGKAGAASWQFPPGPPHNSRIVYATVQVFESRMYAVGTAYYADGSSAADFLSMKENPLPCPEIPGN